MTEIFNEKLFKKFISLDCDRAFFIQRFLNHNGLEVSTLSINDKKHLYVKFPFEQYDSSRKVKNIIAHYDRVADSPGANDNSLAVFLLMNWAISLFKSDIKHNIRLIFSDGEEDYFGGVKSQGAFALAEIFRKLKIVNEDFFVFDCLGRGDTPVLCKTLNCKVGNENDKKNNLFLESLCQLEAKARSIIKKVNNGQCIELNSNFSDNASFLANGIPAVAITMLPQDEAFLVKSNQDSKDGIKTEIPLTWKYLHTTKDDFDTLTPEHFEKVIALFNAVLEI